jgi:hypothetical protein
MGMKQDSMRNHQLRAAYNLRNGTEGQFIEGYSIRQKPTDTSCLVPRLKVVKKRLGRLSTTIVEDAGYESREYVLHGIVHQVSCLPYSATGYRRDCQVPGESCVLFLAESAQAKDDNPFMK